MGTVTGYTAAHMDILSGQNIISGSIIGDNLVLTSRNGNTLSAGNVRGPKGDTGAIGTTAGVLDAASPLGLILPFAGTSIPSTSWRFCDGTPLLVSQYQALWGVIGTAYGATGGALYFNLPNLSDRFPIGRGNTAPRNVPSYQGGSKDSVVTQHTHSHTHTFTGTAVGNHQHAVSDTTTYNPDALGIAVSGTEPQMNHVVGSTLPSGGVGITFSKVYAAGGHTPQGGNSTDATAASNGVSGTDQNLPPYIVLNYIIRVN